MKFMLNLFAIISLISTCALSYAGEVNPGTEILDLATDMSRPIGYTHYEVPDNFEYGVLRTIIEEQGHQQLKLGNWLPGRNDLTLEQIKSLDFSKLEFSMFRDYLDQPYGGPNMILVQERVNQIIKEKTANDQLVRTLPHEGALRPASDVALSQDEINDQLAKARFSWWLEGTPENHAKYISALGMAAARRNDIANAKYLITGEIATGDIK